MRLITPPEAVSEHPTTSSITEKNLEDTYLHPIAGGCGASGQLQWVPPMD
jgi:hypothetical protein